MRISKEHLAQVRGGLNIEGRRLSYNVEDRRPGAGSRAKQVLDTYRENRRNGFESSPRSSR